MEQVDKGMRFAGKSALRRILTVSAGAMVLSLATQASAQQVPTGPVLPAAQQPFKGKIGKSYSDSTASFPAPVAAPAGAPNILLVLTDDVGFGAASTFGGPIPTPNLDRLAARGLIYNRFHTTAMCSPTRASLLTGRNHHAVGNGIVANLTTGFPGYNNLLPKSAATIALIVPMVALGLPIMDTACAIIRRFNNGQPIFKPDRGHLHHRLLDMGLTQKQVVLILYLVTIILGVSAIVMTEVRFGHAAFIVVALLAAAFVAARKTGVLKSAGSVKGR